MSFLSSFYDVFLSRKSIYTWWSILISHKKFFSNYLDGKNENYEKPGKFIFTTLSIYLLISSIGSYFTTPTWIDVIDNLNTTQIESFENIFNIKLDAETIRRESLIVGSSDVSKIIKLKSGSIELEKISDYLSSIGEHELALAMLKTRDRQNSFIQYIILFMQVIIPLLFIFQSRIIHEFLAGENITTEQSLDVYVYIVAFMYPFLALIEVLAWLYTENQLIVAYMRYSLVVLAIWKVGGSYSHIYNESIVKSYLVAVFSSFMVIIPIFVVVWLFMLFLA